MISKFPTDVTASVVHAPFGFHLFAYLSQRSMGEFHPVDGPTEAGRSIYPQGRIFSVPLHWCWDVDTFCAK